MQINKKFILSLRPCQDRLDNYLKHYSNFNGTWSEFFCLDKITIEDKLWVFTRNVKGMERKQFEFALLCAERTINEDTPQDIVDFFTLIAIMRTSEGFGGIEHLKDKAYWAAGRAAYWAAEWAAYRAADGAAEREAQLEIAKYVMEGE